MHFLEALVDDAIRQKDGLYFEWESSSPDQVSDKPLDLSLLLKLVDKLPPHFIYGINVLPLLSQQPGILDQLGFNVDQPARDNEHVVYSMPSRENVFCLITSDERHEVIRASILILGSQSFEKLAQNQL